MSYLFKPATVELCPLPSPPPGLIIIHEADLVSQVLATIHIGHTTPESARTYKQTLLEAAYSKPVEPDRHAAGDDPMQPTARQTRVNLVKALLTLSEYVPQHVLSAVVVGVDADPEAGHTKVTKVHAGTGDTVTTWHPWYATDFSDSELLAPGFTHSLSDLTLQRMAVNLFFEGSRDAHTVARLAVSQCRRPDLHS